MKIFRFAFLFLLLIPTTKTFSQTSANKLVVLSENQKIEKLLSYISNLKDAKFIRNGTEYDSKAAAEHLRSKWNSAGAEIKTAKDFIYKIASVSSASRKPYKIKFKNGQVMNTEKTLLDELKKIESGKT